MAKKKSIVKKFTKPVKSGEVLAPSQFIVHPKFKPDSYEDSPIDEIKRFRGLDSEPVKKITPAKKATPVKIEFPDREKIKRIAKKLSMLKKLSLENEKKREQSNQVKDWGVPSEKTGLSLQGRNVEQKPEIGFKQTPKPKKEPIIQKIQKTQNIEEKPKLNLVQKPKKDIVPPVDKLPVQKKSKPFFKRLFSKSKESDLENSEEFKKKKRVLDSKEITDIPDLPEEDS